LRGEFVKSFGEKVIANFLFEHQVPYLYEPSERGWLKNYHPDFILKHVNGSGVAIEYFGITGDPNYDTMSDEKRRYWKSKERVGWKLIERGPEDIRMHGVDGFLMMLRTELENEGFVFRRMSEDEIWQQVSKRAIDRFTMATRGFIARCRKEELTPETLQQKISSHRTKWRVEADFLDIMVPLYHDYLERLEAEDKEDFDGLMHRAASVVSEGLTVFSRFMKKQHGDLAKLRFMLIDEYQDFSKLFHSLIEAIRQRNQGLQLFCVGDDWQAINGFAGSDLDYYENFLCYFPGSRRLHISTNYRSAEAIVTAGNAVMAGRPKPAVAHRKQPGTVLLANISDFCSSPNEGVRHGDDLLTPMVLRLVAHALTHCKNIVLLSRNNDLRARINYKAYQGDEGKLPARGIERFRNLIQSYFPEEQRHKIRISTTHGFKGLQGDVVVILDAVTGCYPLIHQDWVFLRLLGENVQSITAEARRLFYVALTRAIDTLVILTEKDQKSPFLEEAERQMYLAPIDWSGYPSVSASSDRLKVYVGNQPYRGSKPTLDIKDCLKQEGYRQSKLNGNWFSWMKTFPVDGFSVGALIDSTWSPNADGVEVRILDEQDNLVGNYRVDHGVWTEAMPFILIGK
jgi:DNA helicase-4